MSECTVSWSYVAFLSGSPVAVFSPRYLLWATVWAAGGSSPPVLSRGVLARPRDRSVPGATAWRGRSVVDSCDSQSVAPSAGLQGLLIPSTVGTWHSAQCTSIRSARLSWKSMDICIRRTALHRNAPGTTLPVSCIVPVDMNNIHA